MTVTEDPVAGDRPVEVQRAFVIGVARPTFDVEAAMEECDAARAVLAREAFTTVAPNELLTDPAQLPTVLRQLDDAGPDLVVVLQATFADADAIIRLAEHTDVPFVVWSFPEPRTGGRLRLNSLCGANLAAFSLRRRGHRVGFVHADPRRCDATELFRAALAEAQRPRCPLSEGGDEVEGPDRTDAGAQLERLLAEARIGVIGVRPDGFEPCDVDAELVHHTIGATVDRVDLDELFDAADAGTQVEVARVRERAEHELDVTPEADGAGLEESARLGVGLDSLVEDRDWWAVATRCWPECMTRYGGAVCAPQAMLCDDGIPAVCEADALGALTALMLQHAAGDVPFIADVVDADPNDDTTVVWHCGVAPVSLADPKDTPTGILHPNRHRALLNQFALRPGVVTIARISRGPAGLRLVIGGGTMLERQRPFLGTCGTLQWDLPVGDVLRTIFELGLEHHVGVVYGDHRDTLVELAGRWGIPVVRLGHTGTAHEASPAPVPTS